MKGSGQLVHQAIPTALDAPGTADQHIIGVVSRNGRENLTGKRAKAALHAVAHDRAADLLRDGDADADGRVTVLAWTDQQDKAGHGCPLAGIRREEIRAAGQRA